MGRSAATCFKIITCGNHSADKDEFEANESKSPSDRRGWSFRKRSARHRVLSNTVISETQSGNKDSPEAGGIYSQAQPNSEKTSTEQVNSDFPDKTYSTESLSDVPEKTYAKEPESNVPEKPSTIECIDEKPQSPTPTPTDEKLVETEASDVDDEVDDNEDVTVTETDVIVIQTAIRVFLARNSLLKNKNAIKLQAAVRGHLVRRHAVGTLRCVQAIVKMQALVRARHARRYIERNDKQATEHSSKKQQASYTSIEKLLSNSFARQLLESTPKTKTINIKCDPSRTDSAWIWLERWMAVSTKLSPNTAEPLQKEEVEHSHSDDHLEAATQSASNSESTGVVESSKEASAVPSESDENLITYDADSLSFQAHHSAPTAAYKLEEPQPRDLSEEEPQPRDSFPLQSKEKAIEEHEDDSFPEKTETGNEQHSAPEESDGKKFSFGSRKASNPAFIAAQSKFVELSSAVNSGGKATSLSGLETETESFSDKKSSATANESKTSEVSLSENFGPHGSVQFGESECGTELSVSSTLDSPDRPEVRVQEDTTPHPYTSNENLDIETHDQTSPGNNHPNIDSVQSEPEHTGVMVDPVLPQVEQKPEPSPEQSPRSHVTFSESQATTPSSKVSVKPKIRSEKSGSSGKRRLGDKSPSSPNQDTGTGTTSLDQLPKDQRSGKRRNSFGSAKSEHVDQEPRDSSSSNSLPSYMQATESARAKAISNNSPRSSPDVHSKDAYVKKRHSLPGSNGRQGSPRIQRSLSQAQQNAKGNGTQSPQERRWQR